VSRKVMLLAAIVALVLAAAVPALAGSGSSNHSAKGAVGKGDPVKSRSDHNKDFAGLVDIGGGRKIYMECRGKGSPTVVFVSGGGDRTETWSKTIDPSKQAVLPAIAETNRVCAYDRPGTFLVTDKGKKPIKKSRSTPVRQPTTLQDGVSDLHALLRASGERGPYVVVGHSLGGAIAKLYASEHPGQVSGLVLIDYLPYQARTDLTDKQWGYWKDPLLGSPSEELLALYPRVEQNANQRNFDQDSRSKPLKPMPFIVFSADEPYDLTPFVDNGTLPLTVAQAKKFGEKLFKAVVDARADLVNQVPGARHITNTHSGHYIHQEHPKLVTNNIRKVIEAARKKASALGSTNHG
jgi:pimeloyl-ACP methyl ester carboxylesterase